MRSLLIAVLFKSLAWFDLPTLHRIGAFIGRMLYLFPNKAKLIVTANIRHCFASLDETEQTQLIKQILVETGKTFTENIAFWSWPAPKLASLIHDTPSTQQLKEAVSRNQGIIALTPHLGAWEIVGLYCAQFRPITCLYRPPRMTELEPLIISGRARMGIKTAPITQQGIRTLTKALKEHEWIGILPDQDPGENGGVFAPFFDHPANTMTLVSRFAMKGNYPVFCVYAERLANGQGYRMHCIAAPPALSQGSVEDSVCALNRMIEECVRHLPTQYQWSYKRFKNQPSGMPNIYRKKI